MSILLQDNAEGSVREREMIDMVYSLACHLLHSTRWQDDGIVLQNKYGNTRILKEQWKDIMVLKLTSTVNELNPLHTKQFLLAYTERLYR